MTAMESRAGGLYAARPRVLCVDDEPLVLEGLRDVLHRSFEAYLATSGTDGLEILRSDPGSFAVVISDMRMPGMPGADFLRAARLIAPDAVRVLLTGHADLQDAVHAVNAARLFRFLLKPCDSAELMRACAGALGQHRLQLAERELLEQTLRGSIDALAEALSLTNPAAFGRARRVKAIAGKLARKARVANWWEVEVAATLAQLGAMALPPATAEKLYAGAKLTEPEAAMVARIPALTHGLLSKIPRLQGVLEILDSCHDSRRAEPLTASTTVPLGARILRIASDYAELEADGAASGVALGAMRSRGVHDRPLLDLLAEVVGAAVAEEVKEVSIAELNVGMTLVSNVRSTTGTLLVARGHAVTNHLIERLRNLGTASICEPVRIIRGGGEPNG